MPLPLSYPFLAGMIRIPTGRIAELVDFVAVRPPFGFLAVRAAGDLARPLAPQVRLGGQRFSADFAVIISRLLPR